MDEIDDVDEIRAQRTSNARPSRDADDHNIIDVKLLDIRAKIRLQVGRGLQLQSLCRTLLQL